MSNPIAIPNPLDRYPAVRQVLYLAQWLITGIQSVFSAYFAFAEGTPEDWPRWFLASLAVGPVFWAYFGRTAQTNVWNPPDPGTPHEAAEDERGVGELDLILKVAALAALVLVAIILLARLL